MLFRGIGLLSSMPSTNQIILLFLTLLKEKLRQTCEIRSPAILRQCLVHYGSAKPAIVEFRELERMKPTHKLFKNPDAGVGKGEELMSLTSPAAHTAQPPRQKCFTLVFHVNQTWGCRHFHIIVSFVL